MMLDEPDVPPLTPTPCAEAPETAQARMAAAANIVSEKRGLMTGFHFD